MKTLAATVLGMTLLATSALGQTAQWAQGAALPFARSEAVAIPSGGKTYLVSGNSRGNQANMLTFEFDPARGAWRELALMPNVASHAGGAAIDGKIYIVGGFVANVHFGAMNRVFEYDPARDAWRALAPLPTPRGSPVVVALNGKIHAIAGRDANLKTLTAHEVYDPATNSWTQAAPIPVARDHAGGAVLNGRIHVYGGRTDAQVDNTGRHDVYDPMTNSWRQAAAMATPRSAGVGGVVDGRIVYAGGECKDIPMGITYDEAEVYDPMTDRWTSLGRMPSGRHAAAAVSDGTTLYIFGGNNGCGGQRPLAETLTLKLGR